MEGSDRQKITLYLERLRVENVVNPLQFTADTLMGIAKDLKLEIHDGERKLMQIKAQEFADIRAEYEAKWQTVKPDSEDPEAILRAAIELYHRCISSTALFPGLRRVSVHEGHIPHPRLGTWYEIAGENLSYEILWRLGYLKRGESIKEREARTGDLVIQEGSPNGVLRFDPSSGEAVTEFMPGDNTLSILSPQIGRGFPARIHKGQFYNGLDILIGFDKLPTVQSEIAALYRSVQNS
jgi:hypothetical protein